MNGKQTDISETSSDANNKSEEEKNNTNNCPDTKQTDKSETSSDTNNKSEEENDTNSCPDTKQTDKSETSSNANNKSEEEKNGTNNCPDCDRALSMKTGKCYYCSEEDPETIKNLSFVMLDWQHQAALDSEGRASEKAEKTLSLLFAFSAAGSIALGMSGMANQYYPAYLFIVIGLVTGTMGAVFKNGSLPLIAATIFQTFCMFFYIQLAFKFIPGLIPNALVSGLGSAIAALSVILVIVRIIKNKAIEIWILKISQSLKRTST